MSDKVYLLLKAVSGKNDELDPFNVGKTLKRAVNGDVGKTNVIRNGEYLIQVSATQAEKLLKVKKLHDGTRVHIYMHPSRNASRCVIRHNCLMRMSNEKLVAELGAQKVSEVKAIGESRKVRVLTIKGCQPPPFINVGPLRIRTTKYYPMVKHCKNCQCVGHITDSCKDKKRCYKCCGSHIAVPCPRDWYCGNCGGAHKAGDKKCLVMKQERDIIKIMVDRDIRAKKARKAYKREQKEYFPLPDEEGGGFFVDDDEEPSPAKLRATQKTGSPNEDARVTTPRSQSDRMLVISETTPPKSEIVAEVPMIRIATPSDANQEKSPSEIIDLSLDDENDEPPQKPDKQRKRKGPRAAKRQDLIAQALSMERDSLMELSEAE